MSEIFRGTFERAATWRKQAIPEEKLTPDGEFSRGLEEIEELHEAIADNDGSPERRHDVASEATDVIFRMLGVIESVGGDPVKLLADKMGVIEKKYPARVIEIQTTNGVPFEQAMSEHKTGYQNPDVAKVITLYPGKAKLGRILPFRRPRN